MQTRFHCPHCDLPMLLSKWQSFTNLTCPSCQRPIQTFLTPQTRISLTLENCLLCSSRHLFLQKSFNRNLGFAIVIIGIILSFWTYGISLLVVALIDLILYRFLPPMMVCYCCDAEFRGFKRNPRFKAYNHLKAAHVKKQPTYPGAEEASQGETDLKHELES